MKSSEHASLITMIMNKHIVIAALSAFVPLAATGANVLVNPGFELTSPGAIPDDNGNVHWANFNVTAGNAAIQSTIFHSGNQALELNVNPTGIQGFSIVFQNTGDTLATPQIENQTWNYSFWVYTTGGTGNFSYQFMSSNNLNQDQLVAGTSGTIAANTLATNTWVEITGTFVAPDAAPDDSTLMKATFRSENGTSKFYIDDVSLSSVPEPASLGLFALTPLLVLRRRRA